MSSVHLCIPAAGIIESMKNFHCPSQLLLIFQVLCPCLFGSLSKRKRKGKELLSSAPVRPVTYIVDALICMITAIISQWGQS